MERSHVFRLIFAGFCAGAVNGLLGAGGGMILVPLLIVLCRLPEEEVFPTSIAIMLPVCLVSLLWGSPSWPSRQLLLPCLAGSALGGLIAGKIKIPTIWLHRPLGIFILWGGVRQLWG